MRIPVNPLWFFVAAALVVLVVISVMSRRGAEAGAATPTGARGARVGPSFPTALSVLALAVLLVPLGIGVAAIWGPSAGVIAYVALLAGGSIGLAGSRRSRGGDAVVATTDRADREGATSRTARSRSRWPLIGGVAFVALVVAGVGLFVVGHVIEGDAPSFPSLIDHPDPTIRGTVAYVDDSCVRVVPAGGGPSQRVLCLPPLDPEKVSPGAKPIGPQLVWLPDGRLEVTMIDMDVSKAAAGRPPDFTPAWQKIVDVRTGAVTDVPAVQVPAELNLTTRPVVSPSGGRIRFTSDAGNGHVTITLTDAAGHTRTLLDADGPGEYTYGLRTAFWSPDSSYVVADDGRILIVSVDEPSRTRQLVANPNVFGDNSRQAGFAVTAQNLLPSG